MQLKDQLGPDKPSQMSGSVRQAGRMAWYRGGLAVGALGIAWWWFSTAKRDEELQEAAVEKWGRHGEKAAYGKSFQETVNKGDHFPGIPAAETNAPGGHSGGAVKGYSL